MYQSVELITPHHASKLLEGNTGNRNKRAKIVKALSESMIRGEWMLTHQGVALSNNGTLLDGQHRLEAIVLSGVSVRMVVWRDVDADTFKVMDKGFSRTISDSTGINKKTAESLGLIFRIINGRVKMTPSQAINLDKIFGKYASDLNEFAPAATKTFSSVGVRTAVIVLTMMGFNVSNIYRKLTLSEFDGLPPVMNLFVKKCVSNTITSKLSLQTKASGYQEQLFFSAMYAFDPRNKDNVTLPKFTDALFAKTEKKLLSIISAFSEANKMRERMESAQ